VTNKAGVLESVAVTVKGYVHVEPERGELVANIPLEESVRKEGRPLDVHVYG
jgi:hypothetical protein